MALKVGELYALFSIDASGIDGQLSGIEKQCQQIGSTLQGAGKKMTKLFTLPTIAAGKSIISTGKAFESQMSRVGALMGDEGTPENMERISASAKEMGRTTVFTAQQAGQAMEYMAIASWRTEEIVAAIPHVLNLAAASGEDLAATSDIVTDAMTAFGLTLEAAGGDSEKFGEWVENFVNVLASAAVNSNTDVGKMGETFKYVAPLAGQLGFQLEDVAVAIGLMANRGTKASQAGTSLRMLLSNLLRPSKDVGEAFAKLGISLTDANGRVKSFRELMLDIRRVGQEHNIDLSGIQEQVDALNETYGEALKNNNYEEYAELLSDIEQAKAVGAFDVIDKEGNTVFLEDRYNEAIEAVRSQFEGSLELFDEYDAKVKEIAGDSSEVMSLLAKAGGIRGLNALLAIVGASDEEFASLSEAIYESNGAGQDMADKMLDNLGGAMTLLQSNIDGLKLSIYELYSDSLKGFVEKANEWVTKLNEMDEPTKKFITDTILFAAAAGPALMVIGGIVDAVGKLGPLLSALVSPTGLIIASLALMGIAAIDSENKLGTSFENLAGKISDKMTAIGNVIQERAPQISDNVAALTQSIVNGFSTLFISLVGLLPSVVTLVSEGLKGMFKGLADTDWTEIIGGIITAITATITTLGDELPSVISGFVDAFFTIFDNLFSEESMEKFATLGENLITAIGNALTNLAGSANEVIPKIVSGLSSILSKITSSDFLGMLSSMAINLVTAIGDAIATVDWAGLGSQIGTLATNLVQAIVNVMTTADGGEIIGKIAEVLISALSGLADAAMQIATTIIKGIIEVVTDPSNWAGLAEAAVTSTLKIGKGIVAGVYGEDFAEQMFGSDEEIAARLKNYKEIAKEMFEDPIGAFTEAQENAKEAAKKGYTIADALFYKEPKGKEKEPDFYGSSGVAHNGGGGREFNLPAEIEIEGAHLVNGVWVSDAAEEMQRQWNEAQQTIELDAPEVQLEAPEVEITEGEGTQMEDATQEKIDQIIEGQNFTADVKVASKVTIEISESNAPAIGTLLAGELVGTFQNSITSKISEITGSISSAAQSSGSAFGMGFLRGMSRMLEPIRLMAQAMGRTAVNALKSSIQEGSPSKLTRQSGVFFGEGFAKGITDEISSVRKVSAGMGTAAANALNMKSNSTAGISASRNSAAQSAGAIDYAKLAYAMGKQPAPVLQMDGKNVAEVNARNTAVTQNSRSKRVALRYGSKI